MGAAACKWFQVEQRISLKCVESSVHVCIAQHIMHNKGDLRVSLLVNEFSSVDIDSLLIQSQHANVAVGAPSGHGDLAGGKAFKEGAEL